MSRGGKRAQRWGVRSGPATHTTNVSLVRLLASLSNSSMTTFPLHKKPSIIRSLSPGVLPQVDLIHWWDTEPTGALTRVESNTVSCSLSKEWNGLKTLCRQVVDNRDGTRSLLNRANKKLLVTFRAENQVKHCVVQLYHLTMFSSGLWQDSPCSAFNFLKPSPGSPIPDAYIAEKKCRFFQVTSITALGLIFTPNCRLRQLLSTSTSDNTSDPSLTKFVQFLYNQLAFTDGFNSRCVDVYLCDNCDKDFDSLQDLITHEKGCGKKEVPTTSLHYSCCC